MSSFHNALHLSLNLWHTFLLFIGFYFFLMELKWWSWEPLQQPGFVLTLAYGSGRSWILSCFPLRDRPGQTPGLNVSRPMLMMHKPLFMTRLLSRSEINELLR